MPPTGPINNVWASNAASGTPEYLTLPSGQTCTARRMGIDGMITAGILTNLDSLTALVQDGPIKEGQAKLRGHNKSTEDIDEGTLMKKIMADPEAMKSMVTMADKAIPHLIVTPVVKLHYINAGKPNQRMLTPDERERGIIYTDQIPFEDKMFLFQWSIGDDTEALHTFRDEPTDAVGRVERKPGVSRPAKRSAGNKR